VEVVVFHAWLGLGEDVSDYIQWSVVGGRWSEMGRRRSVNWQFEILTSADRF
jgi:hypothetical protein